MRPIGCLPSSVTRCWILTGLYCAFIQTKTSKYFWLTTYFNRLLWHQLHCSEQVSLTALIGNQISTIDQKYRTLEISRGISEMKFSNPHFCFCKKHELWVCMDMTLYAYLLDIIINICLDRYSAWKNNCTIHLYCNLFTFDSILMGSLDKKESVIACSFHINTLQKYYVCLLLLALIR